MVLNVPLSPSQPRRRSFNAGDGTFGATVASSMRASSSEPRRRSLGAEEGAPLPERYRAPVRSAFHQGITSDSGSLSQNITEHPLFRNANKHFVDQMIQDMTVELFQPGSIIISEGDLGLNLYFLHRGDVKVSAKGNHLAALSSGTFFGEMALLEKNSKRGATVEATSFCDCRVLHRRHFQMLLKNFPQERAFFQAEADRRARANEVAKERTARRNSTEMARRSSKVPPIEETPLVVELKEPFIAEAFFVSAMLSRIGQSQTTGDCDSQSSLSVGSS